VALAFQIVHHWSHAAAYEHTAEQTAALLGPVARIGAGLYLNYLFLLFWVGDATAWWVGGLKSYDRRRAWIVALIYGFMAFMAFNATVVFGKGAGIRLSGAAASGLLLISLGWRASSSKVGDSTMHPGSRPP
jgi:hypothetical protein